MIKLSLLLYFVSAATDPSGGWGPFLGKTSAPVLLGVIVIGVINEWWVPGKTYRRAVAERDALLALALKGQEVGTRALDAASIIAMKSRQKRATDVE